MLGAGFHLNGHKEEEKKTHVTATPDTILWLKEGFGEKVDFGEWNRSHEIGHLEGRFPVIRLMKIVCQVLAAWLSKVRELNIVRTSREFIRKVSGVRSSTLQSFRTRLYNS